MAKEHEVYHSYLGMNISSYTHYSSRTFNCLAKVIDFLPGPN